MTGGRHAAGADAIGFTANGTTGRSATIVVAVVALVLTMFRVWICLHTPVYPTMGKVHDEGLFIREAWSILDGDWLGNDFAKAMVKTPGFAIFLAFIKLTGLSYQFWIATALVIAAALSAQAIQPVVPSVILRLFVYLAVLYFPIAFSPHAFVSVYRNLAVALLAVIIFASYCALWLRRKDSLAIRWLIPIIVSLPLFWIMNESSIWILPFVGTATALIAISRIRRRDWGATILAATPLIACIIATLAVCCANLSWYGLFATNVRYETSFAESCKLLLSLKGDGTLDDADGSIRWTDEETFAEAFRASPSLAEQREAIEASLFNWAQGKGYTPVGDIYAWALIDATFDSGRATNLVEFERYWRQVANELRQGIESGELATGDGFSISGTTPAITWDSLPEWLGLGFEATTNVVSGNLLDSGQFDIDDVDFEMTAGSWEEQMIAQSLLGGPMFTWSPQTGLGPIATTDWFAFGQDSLATRAWQWIMPFLPLLWVAALCVLVVRAALGHVGARQLLLPIAGTFLSVIELCLAVSWFCNFLGPESLFDYLLPAMALFILCEVTTIAGSIQELVHVGRERNREIA